MRELVLDESEVRARITSMDIDSFSEEFFDFGDKGFGDREVEAGESNVRRLKTAVQWRDVVGFRRAYLLVRYQICPKVVGGLSLSYSIWCQMCVQPRDGAVATELSEETLPYSFSIRDICLMELSMLRTRKARDAVYSENVLTFQAGVPKKVSAAL